MATVTHTHRRKFISDEGKVKVIRQIQNGKR